MAEHVVQILHRRRDAGGDRRSNRQRRSSTCGVILRRTVEMQFEYNMKSTERASGDVFRVGDIDAYLAIQLARLTATLNSRSHSARLASHREGAVEVSHRARDHRPLTEQRMVLVVREAHRRDPTTRVEIDGAVKLEEFGTLKRIHPHCSTAGATCHDNTRQCDRFAAEDPLRRLCVHATSQRRTEDTNERKCAASSVNSAPLTTHQTPGLCS